jgi:uncharacterized protein
LAFQALGIVPPHFHVAVFESHPLWDYTTFLDLGFLALAVVLGWRFLTTGGLDMLRMMEGAPAAGHPAEEHHHH